MEKQIEEIATILSQCGCVENCIDCEYFKINLPKNVDCDQMRLAGEIYKTGYRKASDVAREILAEIKSSLNYIEEQLDEVPDCFLAVKEDIEYLEKKYVEGKSD